MNKKIKLSWINPISHYVYQGWIYFFDKYFKFTMYDEAYTPVSAGLHKKLENIKSFRFLGTFFNLIKNKKIIIKETKKDIVICGDIFTFDLPLFYLFRKKVIFYSEFFNLPFKERWFRKILFFLYTGIFRNKKFLLPTKKSANTFKKITKHILYFPPIYYGNTYDNLSLNDKKLKIIFVGNLNDWKKNVELFFDVLNELHEEKYVFEINIAGQLKEDNKILDKLKVKYKYYGQVSHKSLKNIYLTGNLFILPSISDPIGAVVLEAMAHSLPIIVSKNAGSSDYIENGLNGYYCNPFDKKDIKEKIKKMFSQKIRKKMGEKSKRIIEKYYSYRNEKLLFKRYKKLIKFI